MALTPEGTPYVESTDLVANYPAASLSLANRVDLVGVLPFATSAARATAIPSPTDGQYSYLQDTNSTEFWNGSAWVAAGTAPGLVFLASAALTGSSVNVESVFSATYTNYKIFFIGTTSSNVVVSLRLLSGSTPNTANSYIRQRFEAYGASTQSTSATETSGTIIICAAAGGIQVIDLADPFAASPTFFSTTGGRADNLFISVVKHDVSSSFDGFQVYPSSGTFSSGTVKVYGYKTS